MNTNQLYVGDNYWYINSLKNPDLKWETTSTFDVGLEYGFLKIGFQVKSDFIIRIPKIYF